MSEELIDLVREVAEAQAYTENCRYQDNDKARSRLNSAVKELAYYYDEVIYTPAQTHLSLIHI